MPLTDRAWLTGPVLASPAHPDQLGIRIRPSGKVERRIGQVAVGIGDRGEARQAGEGLLASADRGEGRPVGRDVELTLMAPNWSPVWRKVQGWNQLARPPGAAGTATPAAT